MNVPILFGRVNIGATRNLKSLLLGIISLVAISIVSVNDAVAQSPEQLGEKLADQMLYRFQAEHQFLEAEMKNPPAGVDISKNEELVLAYAQVEQKFKEGGSLIQLLSGVIANLGLSNGPTGNSPSWGGQGGNDQFTADEEFLVEELESLEIITSEEDLNEVFELIRTLKNQ